jgi:hypothetical protein
VFRSRGRETGYLYGYTRISFTPAPFWANGLATWSFVA